MKHFTVYTCPTCGENLVVDFEDSLRYCIEHGPIQPEDVVEIDTVIPEDYAKYKEELESLAAANDLEGRLLDTNKALIDLNKQLLAQIQELTERLGEEA